MSGANHVTGGLAFTGIFCSFWNVNIFSNPWYIVFTLFFALLPDIDHTKSPMGKAFSFTQFPQYLNRNYGHRTITHSLLVYFLLGLLIYFVESIFSSQHIVTLIFFLSYFSHLIFDMMTVSGVPLFFPFKKNPCVIPGNPDYRLRANNIKSESIVFVFFLAIMIFCYPLMKNGFWTSFNRSFGTNKHLYREYLASSDLLQVDYEFTNKGNIKKGVGLLVHAEPDKAYIFDNSEVFEVNEKMLIKHLIPDHTQQLRKESEQYFYNISYDSLSILLDDNILLDGDFQATIEVGYWTQSEHKKANVVKLEYDYNPLLEIVPDSSHNTALDRLEIKRIELKEKLRSIEREKEEYKALLSEINDLNSRFESMTLAEQESAVNRLKTLDKRKLDYHFSELNTEKILKQIEQLESQINQYENVYFTGKFTCLNQLK